MKTERLALKLLLSDKRTLQRMAQVEGEPVAVIVRKIIRRAVQEFRTSDTDFYPVTDATDVDGESQMD